MINRSTNNAFTHFGGDIVSNVESSHGVMLSGGSTGGRVDAFGDDANIALTLAGKGTGATVLGNSSSPVTLSGNVTLSGSLASTGITSTHVNIASTRVNVGSASTTAFSLMQRYRVDATVPALSSASSAESTVTIVGLSTASVLILQNRVKLNSTVTGVTATPRCSTADELTIEWHNISQSSLSGSTQSFYLLEFRF